MIAIVDKVYGQWFFDVRKVIEMAVAAKKIPVNNPSFIPEIAS